MNKIFFASVFSSLEKNEVAEGNAKQKHKPYNHNADTRRKIKKSLLTLNSQI